MSFIPLHVHSQYSLLNSTLSFHTIAKRAKEYQMSCVALTDFGNMYGAVDFYKYFIEQDLRPICGMEIMVSHGNCREKKRQFHHAVGYPIILLAKNYRGYRNLCKLSSYAFTEGFYYYPRVDKDLLCQFSRDLICLSGPFYGPIGVYAAESDMAALQKEVDDYLRIFGEDFFFEVSRHVSHEDQLQKDQLEQETWLHQKFQDVVRREEAIIQILKSVGKSRGILCVATNDTRYLDRQDWLAHEILLNIASGDPREMWVRDAFGKPIMKKLNPKRQTAYSHELYFKSPQEMEDLFDDWPEVISNTQEVARKCQLNLDFSKKIYPIFIPPEFKDHHNYSQQERQQESAKYLRALCEEALPHRYSKEILRLIQKKYTCSDPLHKVTERLHYELEIIISKNMCDYILIVHDFISWAKKKGILVGPGRGSGAGSIILYLLGITDIEPMRFDLLFERFINPERPSYPDIDIDICMARRSEVIDYIIQKYGKEKVAQIITFGTMKARMAIRDVGRILDVSLAKVNAIVKLIPEEADITIAQSLEKESDLKKQYLADNEVRQLLDLSQSLEGSIRNTGVHAAGFVICEEPLIEHIPLCRSKESSVLMTQYSMKPLEKIGLLKIDLLGLKTLTSIQKAQQAIHALCDQKKIEWSQLPLNDAATFSLLNRGDTEGVFQLESPGMRELLRELPMSKFEELIAVIALFRPGPMEMIPSFINRKIGKEKVYYEHVWVKESLEETYGIMVYQEQVMQMASRLAHYSLAEGDVLRRAIGKKDKQEMERQRKKFLAGAASQGVDSTVAQNIFEKIEKFASYGFNKSHAAAYAYLSYVTAYFKANFPGSWMAALMTCDMHDLSKSTKHIRECQSMNLQILPPDVNESDLDFVSTTKGIRFSLVAIKGIGASLVEAIVREREAKGKYQSLRDFLFRVDFSIVWKKAILTLIESGCFDFTGYTRENLAAYFERNINYIERKRREQMHGVMYLFRHDFPSENDTASWKLHDDHNDPEKTEHMLQREKELLGVYLTGHPLERFQEKIRELQCLSIHQLANISSPSIITVSGILESMHIKISTKEKKKFAIFHLGDGKEGIEIAIWPTLFTKYGHLLKDNALLVLIVQVELNPFRVQCRWMASLVEVSKDQVEKNFQKLKEIIMKKNCERSSEKRKETYCVSIIIDIDKVTMYDLFQFTQLLRKNRGGDPVYICFHDSNGEVAHMQVGDEVRIEYTQEIERELHNMPYILSADKMDVEGNPLKV